MILQDTSNDDLLAQYGELLVRDTQGRQQNKQEDLYFEILRRMRPEEPLKTEKRIFAELRAGDLFLGQISNRKYLVIKLGEQLVCAVILEGERAGGIVGFLPDARVYKIIK